MDHSAIKERYDLWLEKAEGALKDELKAIADDDAAVEDRFYRELSFGTAGIRGVMGAGTNRMNIYTVRRATRGLAVWLQRQGTAAKGIAIAYDTRHHSAEFAKEAALTLAGCGVKAYLYRMPSPVPLLSYTVRHLGCAGGIAITASHNTKEYNGYKVYDQHGCQMVSEAAEEVAGLVVQASYFEPIPDEAAARAAGLLTEIGEEVLADFCDAVMAQRHHLPADAIAALKVVYTPIHGSGLTPVSRVLAESGFNVTLVAEQADADGEFPTVKKPNPEEAEALELGIDWAERNGADIVLGTDPDCDRVGIAVWDGDGYRLLNGNQIGALLVDHLLTVRKDRLGDDSVILKSIVTDDLGAAVAAAAGVATIETLTGFKYIGEAMTAFAESGEHRFLMGYEESYGFLVGDHARDKDAVVASLLICEMAAYHKARGQHLAAVLDGLYERFGYYLDAVDSVVRYGSDGQERIGAMMAALRSEDAVFGAEDVEVLDFRKGLKGLPAADVLKFVFADGSWLAARPSGTEPKLKIYYAVKGRDRADAEARLAGYRQLIKKFER